LLVTHLARHAKLDSQPEKTFSDGLTRLSTITTTHRIGSGDLDRRQPPILQPWTIHLAAPAAAALALAAACDR
jgi:hypothetical protein